MGQILFCFGLDSRSVVLPHFIYKSFLCILMHQAHVKPMRTISKHKDYSKMGFGSPCFCRWVKQVRANQRRGGCQIYHVRKFVPLANVQIVVRGRLCRGWAEEAKVGLDSGKRRKEIGIDLPKPTPIASKQRPWFELDQ